MYKIGELSRLSHIPVKTLRYYDNEGLLPPDYIDDFTGYRYYSAAKLSDCYRILSLKELGFSLNEIKELFSLPDEKFSELLDAKTKELQQLIKQTENRINILRSLTSTLKENTAMFDIVVRNSDAIRLLYQRKIITDKSECNYILSELHNAIPDRNLGSRTVLIDYETEFASESFDTGFGAEIIGNFPIPDGFSEKIIQFTTDTANLICTEKEYEDALKTLHKYALDNNYQIIGPTYKIIYQDNTVELKLPVVKLEQKHSSIQEEVTPSFENDSEVIGHWELFDLLPCREMFHPQKQKNIITDDHIKELYFLPNGEKYWCFSWTKGLLLSDIGYPHNKVQNKYTVVTIGNQAFLFVEFKGKDYSCGGQPELWVYKKTDSKEYTKQEIELHDEIESVK